MKCECDYMQYLMAFRPNFTVVAKCGLGELFSNRNEREAIIHIPCRIFISNPVILNEIK